MLRRTSPDLQGLKASARLRQRTVLEDDELAPSGYPFALTLAWAKPLTVPADTQASLTGVQGPPRPAKIRRTRRLRSGGRTSRLIVEPNRFRRDYPFLARARRYSNVPANPPVLFNIRCPRFPHRLRIRTCLRRVPPASRHRPRPSPLPGRMTIRIICSHTRCTPGAASHYRSPKALRSESTLSRFARRAPTVFTPSNLRRTPMRALTIRTNAFTSKSRSRRLRRPHRRRRGLHTGPCLDSHRSRTHRSSSCRPLLQRLERPSSGPTSFLRWQLRLHSRRPTPPTWTRPSQPFPSRQHPVPRFPASPSLSPKRTRYLRFTLVQRYPTHSTPGRHFGRNSIWSRARCWPTSPATRSASSLRRPCRHRRRQPRQRPSFRRRCRTASDEELPAGECTILPRPTVFALRSHPNRTHHIICIDFRRIRSAWNRDTVPA